MFGCPIPRDGSFDLTMTLAHEFSVLDLSVLNKDEEFLIRKVEKQKFKILIQNPSNKAGVKI